MKDLGKVSILHITFLTMTVIGLKNHVTIIPEILKEGGRDGWISVVVSGVLFIPWLLLVVYIHNKSNQMPIKDWLTESVGKIGANIILYVTAIFLLIIAAFTMVETLEWVTTTFLPITPIIALLIIYTIVCIMLASTDIQTIVMVNAFVLFGVIVLGFFVAITNIQVKDYALLRPFLEHGMQPVIKGMVYPASGYIELLWILFLQQYFKSKLRFSNVFIMLFLLIGLTMGPLIGAITEFGPTEAAKQRFPAFEEWGLASIGRFIEHLDFFSIYQWLTGALIRVVFILYVVAELFRIERDRKRISLFIAPAFFIICLFFISLEQNVFFEWKGKYLLPISFIYFLLLSFILGIVTLVSGKNAKQMPNDHTESEVK